MNQKSGVASLRETCRRGILKRALEKYIDSCREYSSDGAEEELTRKRGRRNGRFPNIAGFCRYHKISIRDLEALSNEFPEEINLLYAILEDEALNSGLPPAVLSAYLKKRLGYDKDNGADELGETMTIRFEHNILDDGE